MGQLGEAAALLLLLRIARDMNVQCWIEDDPFCGQHGLAIAFGWNKDQSCSILALAEILTLRANHS